MIWTDEAIEQRLNDLADMPKKLPRYLSPGECGEYSAFKELRDALLELKRVRAWIRYGLESSDMTDVQCYTHVLSRMQCGDPAPDIVAEWARYLNGDPAPSEEAR